MTPAALHARAGVFQVKSGLKAPRVARRGQCR
jgi:hypothetical protein